MEMILRFNENSMTFKLMVLLALLLSFLNLSTQINQIKVVAENGDGIYSILKKNNYSYSKYLKEFILINKSNIGNNNSLFIGRTYILPIKKNSKYVAKIKEYPIFGEKHKKITIDSDTLKNAVFYLISGHGGPDPGATEYFKNTIISEDEYAYDVTLRLAKKLISKGAKVYLIIKDTNDGIRDNIILSIDYDEINFPNEPIPLNQLKRLKQRTNTANKLFLKHQNKYQRIIAIHVDSRSKNKNIDVFFYHHKYSSKGKSLASSILNSFKSNYSKFQPNRKYYGTVSERSNLYLIKNTLAPIVYIELGNIKNKKDQKRILDYKNREALAKWMYKGILVDYATY